MTSKNLLDYIEKKDATPTLSNDLRSITSQDTVAGNFDIKKYLTQFRFVEDAKFTSRNTNDSPSTIIEDIVIQNHTIKRFVNEFWTAKQRQASSIHEVSYRACFKPQLPRFFINLLSQPKDVIYDPFSGRGTTVLEAGLLKRNFILNDINPLLVEKI